MGKKIFKIFSILFILGCIAFYGYRLVHYYKIYSTNSNWEEVEQTPLYKKIITNSYVNNDLSSLDNGYTYNYKYNKNYVKYSGNLWRIESIDSDGKIRLISTTTGPVVANSTSFKDSIINKYLNDEKSAIYRNLVNPEIYITKTSVCLDDIESVENITCNEKEDYLIGIPSINDYKLTGGIDGYIKSEKEVWLSNVNDKSQYYLSDTGEVKKTKVTHQYEILPIITLSNEVSYDKGDGSIENPYIVGEEGPSVLNQKGVNEYISFSDKIWKIIDQDDTGTKIVLDGVLDEKIIFHKKYNTFESSNIYSYLNKDYYNSFSDSDKEKIVKGKWYIGNYVADDGYNYDSIYESSIEAYIGLLNMNDIGVLEYNNVWTLTPSNSKKDVIYTIGSDGTVYPDSVKKTKYVRPVLYLDSNIKIASGKGSKEGPYVME